MKRILTIITVLVFACVFALTAQIPIGSPYPVELKVNSPSNIAGTYPYGTYAQDQWPGVANLDHTICGELVWAYDETPDSLCCDSVTQDLTGKIALVRRGTCTFGQKIVRCVQAGAIGVVIVNHYANATEDANYVINMAISNVPPYDSLSLLVSVPSVFVSRATGEALSSALDNGTPVELCFYVPSFYKASAAFAYQTPQKEILPLSNLGASFFNTTANEVTLNAKVDITDPAGATTTVTQAVVIPAVKDTAFTFADGYLPESKGVYSAVFTNDLTLDTLTRTFEITDSTFAIDNTVIDDWTAVDSASFASGQGKFDVGGFYLTSLGGGGVATHGQFAIHNPAAFNGAPFDVILYDCDPDGDGQLPTTMSYDNFQAVAFGQYTFTASDTVPDQLITVELDPPVTLKDTDAYILMIRYDGVLSGLDAVPQYSVAGRSEFRNINTVVYGFSSTSGANVLFTGGWADGSNNVARLFIQGNISGTITPLAPSKINVYPNPASNVLNVELNLNGSYDKIDAVISDYLGHAVKSFHLNNVHQGLYPVNISDLPSGMYFLNVNTPEGFRSKMFNVAR